MLIALGLANVFGWALVISMMYLARVVVPFEQTADGFPSPSWGQRVYLLDKWGTSFGLILALVSTILILAIQPWSWYLMFFVLGGIILGKLLVLVAKRFDRTNELR